MVNELTEHQTEKRYQVAIISSRFHLAVTTGAEPTDPQCLSKHSIVGTTFRLPFVVEKPRTEVC